MPDEATSWWLATLMRAFGEQQRRRPDERTRLGEIPPTERSLDRKGQRCRLLTTGKMNSVLIEFEDRLHDRDVPEGTQAGTMRSLCLRMRS